jgi:hypothetical protein
MCTYRERITIQSIFRTEFTINNNRMGWLEVETSTMNHVQILWLMILINSGIYLVFNIGDSSRPILIYKSNRWEEVIQWKCYVISFLVDYLYYLATHRQSIIAVPGIIDKMISSLKHFLFWSSCFYTNVPYTYIFNKFNHN